jgi:excisionase family DNA binding protein
MEEDNLTLREVAHRFGISLQAVLRWVTTGKLPATKQWYGASLRFRYMVKRSDVERIYQELQAHRSELED